MFTPKVRNAAAQAVSKSVVKIKGLDVLASKKVWTSIELMNASLVLTHAQAVAGLTFLPLFWTFYLIICYYLYGAKAAIAFAVSLPFLSYLGYIDSGVSLQAVTDLLSLVLAEEGMANAKSLLAIVRIKWIGSTFQLLD